MHVIQLSKTKLNNIAL